MNIKEALSLIGGLGEPSKMPCYTYSTSAERCKTGSKLKSIAGSVCNKCYAMRGNYLFDVVKAAHERRFQSLSNPEWVAAMTLAIQKLEYSGHFRWHDSGDIQDLPHLIKIVQVARNLPKIKFWLPTREYGIVAEFVRKVGPFPRNLIVRLSSYMMEGAPPVELAKKLGVKTSGVSKEGFTCPAPSQGNKCLDCRACWNSRVANVIYKRH